MPESRPAEPVRRPAAPDRPRAADAALAVVVVLAGVCLAPLAGGWQPRQADGPAPPTFHVNPNTADRPALQLLPGVGPALAERIIAQRADAPFTSTDDLQRVKGIGRIVAGRLEPYVRFE